MRPYFHKLNEWLTSYVYYPGDDEQTVLIKIIWWVVHVVGLPILLLGSVVIGFQAGNGIFIMNIIFLVALLGNLTFFHFYRQQIELYALVTQIGIVVISSVKVYLMGGLLLAGGPVFIGLIGPIYALTLPNKKRALFVILLYLFLMSGVTIIQPQTSPSYLIFHYFIGFLNGVITIFAALYYYNWQLEKIKLDKEKRMQELDEFKTNFYTNITHEFRTPLTIILGVAEQIKANEKNLVSNEGFSMIIRSGKKLLNLTNQMLSLSKLEAAAVAINMMQDDVIEYIKFLVESFHSYAKEKSIELKFSANPDKIQMDFDSEKIQDIISNLLTNAIKFTPQGGCIRVTVFKTGKGLDKMLVIRIADSGVGISKDHLPKIFNRYYQVDEYSGLSEGTGLGLALTKELVNLLKGKIKVESKPHEGSTFTVFLPIRNKEAFGQIQPTLKQATSDITIDQVVENNLEQPSSFEENLTILIIEDNSDVLRYLKSLLSDEYQVIEAVNGLEGFEKAITIVPDLIISDVMMPKMDGFTLCEKIKNDLRTSHIPVVLLTAKGDQHSRITGLEAGADAYLIKPFNRKELFVRINKLTALRKSLQERYTTLLTQLELHTKNEKLLFKKEDLFLRDVSQKLVDHLQDEDFGIYELCQSLGMSRSQL
ncbi:MAG: hybrid sensor histidine kinase/response regulator, partial [Bacteroidia bacterium]|nr:hybrid sensor histidine kinase/response regulator [Bacteroidia bacterium]